MHLHWSKRREATILLFSVVAFVIIFVLYTGNAIRFRFDGRKSPMPFWRLSITRGVLIIGCVVVVTVTASEGHFIAAVLLAFMFGCLAWMAGRDVVIDKRERMKSLYRALGRVDAGTPRHRSTPGPVGRWAAGLREADYAVVARTVAAATELSDASADQRLREMYDRGATGVDEARGEERVQK